MPNHVTNTMIIRGRESVVRRAFALVWNANEGSVDFNLVRPMPSALEGSTSPTRIMTEEEIAAERAERDKRLAGNPNLAHFLSGEPGITEAELDRRISEYGAANWYDWSIANWGTKWNAYDSRIIFEPQAHSYEEGEFGFAVEFRTAWSQPEEWLAHLVHQLHGEAVVEVLSLDEGSDIPIAFSSDGHGQPESLYVSMTVEVQW